MSNHCSIYESTFWSKVLGLLKNFIISRRYGWVPNRGAVGKIGNDKWVLVRRVSYHIIWTFDIIFLFLLLFLQSVVCLIIKNKTTTILPPCLFVDMHFSIVTCHIAITIAVVETSICQWEKVCCLSLYCFKPPYLKLLTIEDN